MVAGYLDGLPPARAEELARVNEPGLAALRAYLDSGDAVAFLGAGVSAPLYPLWDGLIGELINAASGRLTEAQAATCRALASASPESVVEIVRRSLSAGVYREVLREVLRVRTDPETGRSWTPVQELVCRCAFKAVVTTNYDPGIVNARMRVRPGAGGPPRPMPCTPGWSRPAWTPTRWPPSNGWWPNRKPPSTKPTGTSQDGTAG